MTTTSNSGAVAGRPWARLLLPAAVVGTLFCFGWLGIVHPLSLLILAAWVVGLSMAAARFAPIVFFWLVPLSMNWHWESAIEPYELVIGGLAVLMLIDAWPRMHLRGARLSAIEWRYLAFLATLLTTLAVPHTTGRLFATAKIYTMGLVAYEVARRGSARFGRTPMLLGPCAFAATIFALLLLLNRSMGSAVLHVARHRSALTDLSWGTSNYVAAALAVCLPAIGVIAGNARRRDVRVTGIMLMAGSFLALFLTTSRGGLLLGAGWLASRVTRGRRAIVGVLLGLALMIVIGMATPVGQQVLARFTDAQGIFSMVARFGIWGGAWDRFVQHGFLGVGHGQGVIQGDRLGGVDPHDFILTLLSEGGPLALMAWLWLLAALWKHASVLRRSPATRAHGDAMRATLVLAFLNALFEPTFPGGLYFTLFWWLMGCFAGMPEAHSRERDAAQRHVPGGDRLELEPS